MKVIWLLVSSKKLDLVQVFRFLSGEIVIFSRTLNKLSDVHFSGKIKMRKLKLSDFFAQGVPRYQVDMI